MSSCSGLHCPGCGGGGGGLAGLAVLTVAGIAVYHVITSPAVDHAVTRTVDTVLTIAAITVASIAGIALLAGLTIAGLALRRWNAGRAIRARREPAPLTLVGSRPLSPGRGRAALPGRPAYGSQEPAEPRPRIGRPVGRK